MLINIFNVQMITGAPRHSQFNEIRQRRDAKNGLSINHGQRLFEALKKLREDEAKEKVTDNYKDPRDPNSYGK